MTKDEALRLALEALEELNETNSYWWQEVDEVTTKKIDPAITAIKATLEAKDEPVVLKPCAYESKEKKMCRKCGQVHAEAIWDATPPQQEAKDEPVALAWAEGYRMGIADERTSEANIGIAGFNAKVEPARENPYVTTPPQRKPLTDEEIQDIVNDASLAGTLSWTGYKEDDEGKYTIPVLSPSDYQFARAIEAKLKEKNT